LRLRSIHLLSFKRFTDTRIEGLTREARLIVLAGPNGSGKSSLFDGLRTWHWAHGALVGGLDETYSAKVGARPMNWPQRVEVEFHEPLPQAEDARRKLIYIRSAYRNEADFNITGFNRPPSPLDRPGVARTIDADQAVSDNYQRLIMATIDGIYGEDVPDSMTKGEIRDRIIGKVQASMLEVFLDLLLTGVGGITAGGSNTVGSFYFNKGSAWGFLYKNLSGGEKSAFDLILDAIIKREYFDNSIWCIDEPETHLNTRVQARLLSSLMSQLPPASQMILASHSIGFMRAAWEMARDEPGSVLFIDMGEAEFDDVVTIQPIAPSRDFWTRTLDVAVGDLAKLMAPERVILCEGRPPRGVDDRRAEFDASCYRKIFASEFPNADFLSVGNSYDVRDDRLEAGKAVQTISSGTLITRIADRDLLSEPEVEEISRAGSRFCLGETSKLTYLTTKCLQDFATP
jgi:hypothetical protein